MIEEPCCFYGAFPTEAERIKNIESNMVGQPDLLLMPELNAGKMLYGNSNSVGGGSRTCLVPGARVQIVLTSRTDSPPSRVASAKLARRGPGADR